MKCPYCQNEMNEGYVMGIRRLAWGDNKRKFALYEKEPEITLAENLNVASVLANRCHICNIIIIKN